jgi:hypothetical protein
MKTGDNWSFRDDRLKCYKVLPYRAVLLMTSVYGVLRTARLDTERLRRPMIDAPYGFDIDHPILLSTPDIPHWTLCVVRAESVRSHYVVWDCRRQFVSICSVYFGFWLLPDIGLLFLPDNKVLSPPYFCRQWYVTYQYVSDAK